MTAPPPPAQPAGSAPSLDGPAAQGLYRALFEHAPMEVHFWSLVRDAAGNIVTWRLVDANAAALAAWGRRIDEIAGRTPEEIFPGADVQSTLLPVVQHIMATGQPHRWDASFPGSAPTLRMVSIPVGDGFVCTGVDITQERKRQQELEDALRSLDQATQAGGVGLWDWNLATNEVRFSDGWKRQLGFAPDEIAHRFDEWRSRVHPDDLASTLAAAEATLADPHRPYDVTLRLRHKDGSYRWFLGQASVQLGPDGQPQRMVGSQIDITERRRLEEKVFEAQKLESVGTLAAGIAHDFNNLLMAISGNLSLLRTAPPGAASSATLLKSLEDGVGRASALTKQLLTYAKGGAPVREAVSIGELLVDTVTFVARGSKAQCTFEIEHNLAAVNADLGQLSQVFSNLVINAVQAMPQGGTVRISARNLQLAPATVPGLPSGPCVRITVADDGDGIAPETLGRIFDPFFTTKPAGSGLGLSTCRSIVARHGGSIQVRSTPGIGSEFTIDLPAADAMPRPGAKPQAAQGRGRHRDRVLVMDDDATICAVLVQMLERLGFEADACPHGDEALALYRQALQTGTPYAALILDLTIPGNAGGAQVLTQLRALDPGVPAIAASGYADDDVLARPGAYGFQGRLHKPYDLQSLALELNRVLEGQRPHGAQ